MKRENLLNSLWGFVIGDCLGVPYEFKRKGTFKYEAMKGFGTHNQPAMTWSDDTALMLAMIDAYEKGSFNVEKHKQNLQALLKGQYYVDNILFDIGIGTQNAILRNFTTDNSNSLGNGGLLRCWIAGIMKDEHFLELLSLTHSDGALYQKCCRFYIDLIDEILQHDGDEMQAKEIWSEKHGEAFNEFIKAHERLSMTEGCIVETIKIVLSAYMQGKSISDVAELGGDTDSNLALFCALKGAEGNEAVLKYKKHVRHSEQIHYYVEMLTKNGCKK